MMIKNDIKKMASKLWHHQKGMRSYSIMHPEREWLIGLVVALGLVMAIGSWSAYTYLQNKLLIENGLEVEVVEEAVYRESFVEEAKELFRQRNVVLGEVPVVTEVAVDETEATSTDDVVEESSEDDDTDLPEEGPAPEPVEVIPSNPDAGLVEVR